MSESTIWGTGFAKFIYLRIAQRVTKTHMTSVLTQLNHKFHHPTSCDGQKWAQIIWILQHNIQEFRRRYVTIILRIHFNELIRNLSNGG